jgi:hypothetical protein
MRKYDDVERIGKEEVEGLLNGEVHIFEKIDGANVSLYWDSEKGVCIASRNTEIYSDKNGGNFRGIIEYLKKNPSLRKMVEEYPNFIFYGEWLVPHKVKYPEGISHNIWFFDIFDTSIQKYLPHYLCLPIWKMFEAKNSPVLGVEQNPTPISLAPYLKFNSFKGSPCQEGIVLKNYAFVNKFGRQQWGKIINEVYAEAQQTKDPKNMGDIELKLVEEYVTKNRIEKIIEKIRDGQGLTLTKCCQVELRSRIETFGQEWFCPQCRSIIYDDKLKEETYHPQLTEKDTGRVMNTVFYDFIQEELWDILKKEKYPVIDFKKLKKLSEEKIRNCFFAYIQNGK